MSASLTAEYIKANGALYNVLSPIPRLELGYANGLAGILNYVLPDFCYNFLDFFKSNILERRQ